MGIQIKRKDKHTGKSYTEKEVNELKEQWLEENRRKKIGYGRRG